MPDDARKRAQGLTQTEQPVAASQVARHKRREHNTAWHTGPPRHNHRDADLQANEAALLLHASEREINTTESHTWATELRILADKIGILRSLIDN